MNRKTAMPSNYKTKICKQFTEEPFYCPYGEKCQFLHVTISTVNQSLNKPVRYTNLLKETFKQMQKRLMYTEDLVDFDMSSVFKTTRLKVFQDLTNSCKGDEESEGNSDSPVTSVSTPKVKKITLNKKSREFHMPPKKAVKTPSPFLKQA